MVDKVSVVRFAYETFLDHRDQESFAILVGHLNNLFDGTVTFQEADDIFETDFSNMTCFWERVRNAKNEAAVPLMVMRRFYLHDRELAQFDITHTQEFRIFCDNHAGIVVANRYDEFDY
jgi:hypothetical protein